MYVLNAKQKVIKCGESQESGNDGMSAIQERQGLSKVLGEVSVQGQLRVIVTKDDVRDPDESIDN